MKKIKLNSAKLILKKDFIGNLTKSAMMGIQGGGDTGYGMCTDFTQQQGSACVSHNNNGDCGGGIPSLGCATAGCATAGGCDEGTCWATQPFICHDNISTPCSGG